MVSMLLFSRSGLVKGDAVEVFHLLWFSLVLFFLGVEFPVVFTTLLIICDLYIILTYPYRPRWSWGNVLASGSNPAEVDGFFQDVNILSTSPLGGTSKQRFQAR